MIKKYYLASILFSGVLLNPVFAQHQTSQASNLDEMVEAVSRAWARKTDKQTVISLCDKIFARDVIADFISHGIAPADRAMAALKTNRELGSYVEQWKEELAANPKSERLNYLLAIAARYYQADPKSIGWLNLYPPVKIRIRRDGTSVTAEVLDEKGDNRESVEIALPGKALIGLAGNATTGRFQNVTLVADGRTVSTPQWQGIQIGGDSTRGSVKVSGDGIELTGVGMKPSLQAADNHFFAFCELDGDGSLEAVVESLSPENRNGAVGLVIRGSLDPSAPFVSLMAERRDNSVTVSSRKDQNELASYLAVLSGLRPHDSDFVMACLKLMIGRDVNMTGAAYQAAERLLDKEPKAILKNSDLFREVYSISGHADRFSQRLATASSPSGEQSGRLVETWLSMAEELQHRGKHEEAIALWNKAEESLSDRPFPVKIRQKRLISYRKLNRTDDAVAELNHLFLGKAGKGGLQNRAMPTGAELILGTVSIDDPALVPPMTLSLHYAAHYEAARRLSEALESSPGTPEQKGAAEAVAIALRITAKDPATIAAVKKGGANFASQLPPNLPDAGLALIAFELQQFPEGHAAALSVVGRMLRQNRDANSFYSREDLLLWQLRLADFQGNPEVVSKSADALVTNVLASKENSIASLSEAINRLLHMGDAKRAAQVALKLDQRYRQSDNPFDKRAEALGLVDLYLGNAVPMPIVWTTSGDDGVEVRWEFGRDISKLMIEREVRSFGAPIPKLDKRYSLDLYAVRSNGVTANIPEDARIATLSAVDSTGQWKGEISPSHRWIVAAMKDESGNVRYSPAVPAVVGRNFISPIQVDDILNDQGVWSSTSKSFWGFPVAGRFPKNRLFLSRLQPRLGFITLKHQPVPIDPRGDYVFATWMKADNGQGEAVYSFLADAFVEVVFFNAEGKPVAEWKEPVSLGGSWTLLTHQFGASKGRGILPLPPNATSAEVRVNLRTQCEIGDIGFYGTP